jgi:DNA polymerase-1
VSWASSWGPSGAARVPEDSAGRDRLREALQALINKADIVVGFNFKFDYHWLQKFGVDLSAARIWDCQITEFVLERQQNRYPSLEGSAVKYDLGHKIDIIKLEYWNKGINTDAIPWPVLKPYAIQDADLTLKLFHIQQELVSKPQRQLLALLNADLHVLQEMERNGIVYDESLCEAREKELDVEIQNRQAILDAFYPDIPILWSSNDQLSAFLYGGVIKQTVKDHDGFFKSGARAGQPKFRNREILHQLPRLYQPLRGTELAKEGFYATNEDTLLKLKGKRGPLTVLLELSKLEKLNGTYYRGIPKLNHEMSWEHGVLHGSFNQVVAATGRLSSDKPNLQNMASELNDLFITRFK